MIQKIIPSLREKPYNLKVGLMIHPNPTTLIVKKEKPFKPEENRTFKISLDNTYVFLSMSNVGSESIPLPVVLKADTIPFGSLPVFTKDSDGRKIPAKLFKPGEYQKILIGKLEAKLIDILQSAKRISVSDDLSNVFYISEKNLKTIKQQINQMQADIK